MAKISVNDPELMLTMPKSLTAATGMDALTHAIESMVTPGAYAVTESLGSRERIELIREYLPKAVENGTDLDARDKMVNAIFLGGMAFNNAGLGYVHSNGSPIGCRLPLAARRLLRDVVCRSWKPKMPNLRLNVSAKVAKALGLAVTADVSDQDCADYTVEGNQTFVQSCRYSNFIE